MTGLQASWPPESPEFQVIDEMIGFKGQAGSFHVEICLTFAILYKIIREISSMSYKIKKKKQTV